MKIVLEIVESKVNDVQVLNPHAWRAPKGMSLTLDLA